MTLSVINASSGRSQPNDPTPAHNVNSGWRVGSIMVNSATRTAWVCLSDAPGNGVWARIVTESALGEFNRPPVRTPIDLSGL